MSSSVPEREQIEAAYGTQVWITHRAVAARHFVKTVPSVGATTKLTARLTEYGVLIREKAEMEMLLPSIR